MPNYVFPTARQVICSVLIVAAMTIPLDLYDPESSDSRFPPPTAPHPIIIIMIIKTWLPNKIIKKITIIAFRGAHYPLKPTYVPSETCS